MLFDHFPDGQSVLGGAPFNVAWHLQGFGISATLVSRVGQDALGDKILATMEAWGMDTRGMQRDPEHATGTVEVSLVDGQPSFEILSDQAYDFIDFDTAQAVVGSSKPSVLYMGTLAARAPTSKSTLGNLVNKLQTSIFVDVNLRAPWWDMTGALDALSNARWAKLNDEELITLTEQKLSPEQMIPAAQAFRKQFDLELLILTLGADGAYFVTDISMERGEPVPVSDLQDTVGAGDAFSAVTLLGLINNWPTSLILRRALEFASRICEQRGATAIDHALYKDCLQRWQA